MAQACFKEWIDSGSCLHDICANAEGHMNMCMGDRNEMSHDIGASVKTRWCLAPGTVHSITTQQAYAGFGGGAAFAAAVRDTCSKYANILDQEVKHKLEHCQQLSPGSHHRDCCLREAEDVLFNSCLENQLEDCKNVQDHWSGLVRGKGRPGNGAQWIQTESSSNVSQMLEATSQSSEDVEISEANSDALSRELESRSANEKDTADSIFDVALVAKKCPYVAKIKARARGWRRMKAGCEKKFR